MLYWTAGESEQKMVMWRDWVMWRRAESKLLWGSSELWGRQGWSLSMRCVNGSASEQHIWHYQLVYLEVWGDKERDFKDFLLSFTWEMECERKILNRTSLCFTSRMVYTWSDQNLISDLSALSKHPCGYSVQVALYLTGLGQWVGEQ